MNTKWNSLLNDHQKVSKFWNLKQSTSGVQKNTKWNRNFRVWLPSHRIKWPSELKGGFQNSRTLSIPGHFKTTLSVPFLILPSGISKSSWIGCSLPFLTKYNMGLDLLDSDTERSRKQIYLLIVMFVTFFQIYRKPWAPDRVMAWKSRKLTKSLFPELCAHLFNCLVDGPFQFSYYSSRFSVDMQNTTLSRVKCLAFKFH